MQHDLDENRANSFANLPVAVGPGLCLQPDGFLPDGEALARRQPISHRAGHIGLVRIARPIQRLHHFLAEEEEIVLRSLRKRYGEHATGIVR
ncbi:hypothetical protein D3C87_1645350 [compost metagenome]